MAEQQEEKNDVVRREEEILAFWDKNNIFKKSEEKDAPKGEYIFYDGPPFATGLPHHGHILAGTIKDAIPRYRTMQGYRVVRKWGWDCHGLPLENLIEKELGLKNKRDIEKIGIEVFNNAARGSVLRYADDWKRIIPRMGRWVNMETDYKTMDASYTESVWWVFKTLFDKGLIYEGFKSMHLCPRCGTTLSNFEVAQGYKDITDFAVTVKLELVDEPGTYLLIWTTTPWTLPGNMAAAVHKSEKYVTVEAEEERFILAKSRLSMLDKEYKILKEFRGSSLLGKKYKPPFDYFVNTDLEGKKKAWTIYHAPYVSMKEGTGIVHLAPAFGSDDLELAQEHGIPIVHHVDTEGKFTNEVADFAGMLVKPKDDHQSADIEIIKNLAHRGLLFKKEKVKHSYPHCWRCDTPLLNYASNSWFVKVTSIKNKLIKENKKVHWVPEGIGSGRFGKGLEGAPDWAISRSRYWGAPLPVWRNNKTGKMTVIGSVQELKEKVTSSGNTYYMMRHGIADSNMRGFVSADNTVSSHLTQEGKEKVKQAARQLRHAHIDVLLVSPLDRTQETAIEVCEVLGFSKDKIVTDDRLKEIQTGEFNGKKIEEYRKYFSSLEEKMTKRPQGGENLLDMKQRIGDFLYDIEQQYRGKNILIITHEYSVWMLCAVAEGATRKRTIELKQEKDDFIVNAEVRELSFIPLPHNKSYELDLHRPYIDSVTFKDGDAELVRIPEVFDCWFESGSMPYGQFHYPFENLKQFEPRKKRGFPANFIAEGVDQTRGWFYSLLVLGVALFGKSPYKNVIVNGMILAEDGRKMSKRLKNYPEPMDVVERYGADALRYYLLSSSIMKGEDLNFSEKNVAEVMRKNISRCANVLAFYALYKNEEKDGIEVTSDHVLDVWIIARLHELIHEVTEGMERYELDRATRPIAIFIDDLSTWYLRRSRDRFRGEEVKDKQQALTTTRYVLRELSKTIAPFMPFFAEYLYQEIKDDKGKESVHLESWPKSRKINTQILDDMRHVREIVSLGLEARDAAGIKVRQPLSELQVRDQYLKGKENLLELIKDEVNVKKIVCSEDLTSPVELATELTQALKNEGMVRDVVREIQARRKKQNYIPGEIFEKPVTIRGSQNIIVAVQEKENYIKKETSLAELKFITDKNTEDATFSIEEGD